MENSKKTIQGSQKENSLRVVLLKWAFIQQTSLWEATLKIFQIWRLWISKTLKETMLPLLSWSRQEAPKEALLEAWAEM